MPCDVRTCLKCGQEKPVDEFANAGTVKGVVYRRYECKPCYAKTKFIKKKKNVDRLIAYRKTLSCEACGNSDFRVIEFHHRDPAQKERAVTEMMDSSWDKIEAEIAKCVPLCANCHRIFHWEEREKKKSGD